MQGFELPSEDTNDIVAYCINLDRRPDRWANVQNEWKLFSDHPENLIRVSGVDTGSRAGCGMSHQLVVDQALRKKLPWVVVLEDDIHFKPNVREIWRTGIRALAMVQRCDVWRPSLSGAIGVYRVTESLFEVKDGSGLFFTIYFKTSFNIILNWTPQLGHIDRWITSNPQLLNVCTLPFAATTIEGNSDIRHRKTQDDTFITKTEQAVYNQPIQNKAAN